MAAEQKNITPHILDLADTGQVEKFCGLISGLERPIDLLINNAGYAVRGMVEEVPLDAVRTMYEVNLFAPCRLIQACLPAMRTARSGWIINISSISAKFVWPGNGYYGSTKHAMEGVTDALRHEVTPFGIKVVAIRPGPTATGFGQAATSASSGWAGQTDPDYAPVSEKIAAFFAKVTQSGTVPGPGIVGDLLMEILKETDPLPAYAVGPMVDDYFMTRNPIDEAKWRDLIDEAVGLKGMKL
jgi:short-subunit dehydrogenase